jgi:hypothetical protein
VGTGQQMSSGREDVVAGPRRIESWACLLTKRGHAAGGPLCEDCQCGAACRRATKLPEKHRARGNETTLLGKRIQTFNGFIGV